MGSGRESGLYVQLCFLNESPVYGKYWLAVRLSAFALSAFALLALTLYTPALSALALSALALSAVVVAALAASSPLMWMSYEFEPTYPIQPTIFKNLRM